MPKGGNVKMHNAHTKRFKKEFFLERLKPTTFQLNKCTMLNTLYNEDLNSKHIYLNKIFYLPAIQMPDNCPVYEPHLNCKPICPAFRPPTE